MSIPQSSETHSWLTSERRSWIAGMIGFAILGFAVGNGHTTQGAVSHISAQLGDQKKVTAHIAAVAGCEHARANIATTTAVLSEKGHDVDISDIPNCPPLPKK